MFRNELLFLSGLAAVIFVIVAGSATLALRAVHNDGKMVAEDSLPGLISAGEALSRIDENWFHCQRLLSLDSEQARLDFINKITTNSSHPLWQQYRESIHAQQDQQLFEKMEADREGFLKIRGDYFQVVQKNSPESAAAFFESHLSPAFDQYRHSAIQIFLFSANLGSERAGRILHLSAWTPYALAGFCVMVLLIGAFVGFKASLGAFVRR